MGQPPKVQPDTVLGPGLLAKASTPVAVRRPLPLLSGVLAGDEGRWVGPPSSRVLSRS
jgi:hypothetical protein